MIGHVENGFRRLRPDLPPRSRVYVSVHGQGVNEVRMHLHSLQALSVWYRNPSLATLRPQGREIGPGPEYLFWVAQNLDVVEVTPETYSARSSGLPHSLVEYCDLIRSFALGLAASGDIHKAAVLFRDIPERARLDEHGLDRRVAAALLVAGGERGEAMSLLSTLEPLSPADAVRGVGVVYLIAPRRLWWLGSYLFPAMGISFDDPEAHRALMRWFYDQRLPGQTLQFARCLQKLLPGDRESQAVIAEVGSRAAPERFAIPAIEDSLRIPRGRPAP